MIKDSGNRAVRDIQEGKGRCDLLPLCVVSVLYDAPVRDVLHKISDFQETGQIRHLADAINLFCVMSFFTSVSDMMLEVSIHFEEGAKKYGERNWEKGIPCQRYIDSGVRHFLKFLRGDQDERHDRAFVWNLLCCMWTAAVKPNLNDYMVTNENRCVCCNASIPEGFQVCPECQLKNNLEMGFFNHG